MAARCSGYFGNYYWGGLLIDYYIERRWRGLQTPDIAFATEGPQV